MKDLITMADPIDRSELSPMTSADIEPADSNASAQPVASSKGDAGATLSATATETQDTLKQGASNLRGQATDRVRLLAEDGKSKATDALGQLTQILNDAAAQVDDKIGTQYGQYARNAADQVQSFGAKLDETTVDEIFDEARELVKKSPGVAVGIAAALGFVVARLVSAGVEQRGA
ncbi:hypothetical protein [Sphingomonas sp. Mn802worker]|uniref:hypothetical protein n=1 Tax=Sphingomonas sp. Mn802worker TaxID=629773 RepID=UPI0003772630|nr:hypothetical protein [Sphingomonas sp. Mn802worker]